MAMSKCAIYTLRLYCLQRVVPLLLHLLCCNNADGATDRCTVCGQSYPTNLFAIFRMTVCNFNTTFHALLTCLYRRT